MSQASQHRSRGYEGPRPGVNNEQSQWLNSKGAEFMPIEQSVGVRLPALSDPKKQIRLFKYTRDFPYTAALARGPSITPRFLIDVFDVDRSPEYTALSYEWGPASTTRNILIEFSGSGGIRTKQIRGNLQQFLARLLYDGDPTHSKSSLQAAPKSSNSLWVHGVEDQWLWADQISIDQADVSERNAQVSMMTEIFSNASRVVAWLGDDRTLASKLSYLTSPTHNLDFDFIRCSFWTRLWCQQEVSLARSLVLMAGEHIQQLEGVRNNRAFLRKLDSPGVPRCLHIWSQSVKGATPKLALEDAIRFFSAKECANPRDRIYGVLGMVRPEERIQVNYELSVIQVYYAAFLRAFENLLSQDHPSSPVRQRVTSGQLRIFFSTFELLAQNMGLPLREDSLVKVVLDAYELHPEQLPGVLQQVRAKINEKGEQQIHGGRSTQLRKYLADGATSAEALEMNRSSAANLSDGDKDDMEEEEYDPTDLSEEGYLKMLARMGMPMPIPDPQEPANWYA